MNGELLTLKTSTQDAIDRVEEYLDQYDSLISWITNAIEQWDEYTIEEKEAFRDNFESYRHFSEESIAPEDLEDRITELKELYRQPLQEAIFDTIDELEQVLELSIEGDRETVKSTFNSMSRSQLINQRNSYSEIENYIEELEEPALANLKNAISNNITILTSANNIFEPLVKDTYDKQAKLDEFSSRINDMGWWMPEPSAVGPFPQKWLDVSLPNVEEFNDVIHAINESRSELNSRLGDITPAIVQNLDNIIVDPSQTPMEKLRELETELAELVELSQDMMTIIAISDNIRDTDVVLPESARVIELSESIQSSSYSDIEEARLSVQNSLREFEEWKDSLSHWWESRKNIIEMFEEHVDIEDLEFVGQSEAFDGLIQDDPQAAVEILVGLQRDLDKIRDELREGVGLGDESIELLFDLLEENSVPISRHGLSAVENLAENMDLRVTINE